MANDAVPVPVVYLFHEGKTELGYLQSLAKGRAIRIVPEPSVSSPVRLLESAMRFAMQHAEDLRANPNAEIWVVFDHDAKAKEMSAVRSVLKKCPAECIVGCVVHDINKCESNDILGRIHVALMSPCIEIWGILCTEEGSTMKRFPEDRHELQSLLHKVMPRYDHKCGAQFDLAKMTCVDAAIKRAKEWAGTHGAFPECLDASHYAGICPLVEKIIASPLISPKSWRRQ
ncbi:MAG: RloB domain-containing protein [Kiritimatiellae bacterium]|nr:RloB domain-containing protein [Kiritimatiellia bacterium]